MIKLNKDYLNKTYVFGGRTINPVNNKINFNGSTQNIRRKELELLALLVSAKNEIVERTLFINCFWKHNPCIGKANLTKTIGDLRKTIKDNDPNQPIIRTIPRIGYQINSIYSAEFLNKKDNHD